MQIIHTELTPTGPILSDCGKEWSVRKGKNKYVYTLKRAYRTAYGFGEKFDCVNQKGRLVRAAVIEKCFYQGDHTYLSMPFFLTADGFGVYVDTYVEVDFDFRRNDRITVSFAEGSGGEIAPIYVWEGTPKQIVQQFKAATAPTKVFSKWVLGAWMSSNRWRTQSEIEEQSLTAKRLDFPHSVLVIEPWSDLTTHYIWNGATCPLKRGDERAAYDELDFSRSDCWQDPRAMVERLHSENIRVLLWVIPICARGEAVESEQNLAQLQEDDAFTVQNGECVRNADGTPYEIPKTWCVGSMVPDFTSASAREHWLRRFDHTLEIGIDGFKTDGGEFIHTQDVRFADGTTGREGQNAYCEQYIKAFADHIGEDRVLFSRAGGPVVAANSLTWAGDQESTWSEFRSVVKAGLSAGLSGISNWGFDIAGFAGYLPSKGLYARAVQAAAFMPIMQWHSEPPSNGRCDFSGAWQINDRSPWNVADFYKDEKLLAMLREHFYLHYNLIPYQYALMLEAHRTGVPAVRHLVYEFPEDARVTEIEDEFMLGDALLVAPVLSDYVDSRNVYMPAGGWRDLYTGRRYEGGAEYAVPLREDRIPVYLREGRCVPVNVSGGKLASPVGNATDRYVELAFLVSGEGVYRFEDDLGNRISVCWSESDFKVTENAMGTACYALRPDGGDLFDRRGENRE